MVDKCEIKVPKSRNYLTEWPFVRWPFVRVAFSPDPNALHLWADMDALPKPKFSENLISENRREVKHVVSHPIQQDFNSPSVTSQPITLTLKRGELSPAISKLLWHCKSKGTLGIAHLNENFILAALMYGTRCRRITSFYLPPTLLSTNV